MLNTLLLSIGLALFGNPSADTYTAIVEESSAVWTATKIVGGGHTGTIQISEGSLELDGKKLSGGSFVIDMTTINNTDQEGEWKGKLEGHLKSDDFFAVESFPTSSLNITKVESAGKGKYNVTADLTIKGKTGSVTFPTEINISDNKVSATAKITIDRSKYDVRYGSNSFFDNLGDKAISDEFIIEIKLVASK